MSSLKARISGSVAIRLPASRAKSTCDPVRTSAHTYITPHVCSPTALHCDACSWSSSALSQGPLRLRRHHGRCTPVSRRLPASPKSAAAGQEETSHFIRALGSATQLQPCEGDITLFARASGARLGGNDDRTIG